MLIFSQLLLFRSLTVSHACLSSLRTRFHERELERCPDDGSLLYLVGDDSFGLMDIPLGPGAIVAKNIDCSRKLREEVVPDEPLRQSN